MYVTGGESSDTSTHAAGDRNGGVVKVAPVQITAREPTHVAARDVPPTVSTTSHAAPSRPVNAERSGMIFCCLLSDILILTLLVFHGFIFSDLQLCSAVVAI